MPEPPSAGEVASLVNRLCAQYPTESAKFGHDRLEEMVQQSLAATAGLAINDPEDVFRYAALRVLLTPAQRQSPLLYGTTARILSNLGWDAKHRLDFIYRHVIGRSVSAHELDLGKNFVPKPGPAS